MGALPDGDDRPSLSTERLGSYEALVELASGGMGTVYVAHQAGAAGFERLVVVKRVHRHLVKDPSFRDMFLDEARLASQIRHPNVVPVDDVVDARGELFLVQPYVESVALSALLSAAAARGERLPPAVAVRVVADALAGLAGAHGAVDLRGEPLDVVHRDVSPQNIVVGTDGASRLVDFGIAKASRRATVTSSGVMKGKLAYMAPEQLRQQPVDARADVFAAGVVLYEALTGARPFDGKDEADTLLAILIGDPPPPSERAEGVGAALDAVVERLIARDREERYATAAEAHEALVAALPPAAPREVAAQVERLCGEAIGARREAVRRALELASAGRLADAGDAGPRAPASAPTRVERAPTRVEGARHPQGRAPRRALVGVAVIAGLAAVAAIAVPRRAPTATPAPAASSASEDPPAPSPAAIAAPAPPTATATASAPPARSAPDRPARAPARPRASASSELHTNPYGAPPAPGG